MVAAVASLALVGARITDGTAPPRPATITLEGGKIRAVHPPERPIDAGVTVVDVAGHLVTPALADVHTHLLLAGPDLEHYELELLTTSLPLRTLRGAAHARAMLDRGFLTVRDVCTEGASYADVALRDAIDAGLCEGPRIVPSGPGLGITGGYLPMNLAPGVCAPSGCDTADSPDAARLAVRRQVSHGVSWIKVFADWPCYDGMHRRMDVRPTFTRPELEAIVDEARRRGRRVAAHVTSDHGARHAVECGVASIEHLGPLSRETLDRAASSGVFLVPTLTVDAYMTEHAKPDQRDARRRRIDDSRAAFARALAAGVRIASGSDLGAYPHDHEPVSELSHLVAFGMTPLAALAAATGEAGALLGVEGLGVLREGAVGDLCAFRDVTGASGDLDLLATLTAARPALVVQAGRVVRSRLERGA